MKKTITFISRRAAVLLLMMMLTTAQTAWAWDGLGTQESPYQISSTDDLDLLAHRVNGTHGETATDYEGKYFVLGADISYTHVTDWNDAASTETNYEAIGREFHRFCGHFDGQGHTVSGIRIYKSGSTAADQNQGLFGIIVGISEVRNVTLADARITGHHHTAGIVGWSQGLTITNCHVLSDVTIVAVESDASDHGGIVGYNHSGTVSGCTSAASITTTASRTSRFGGVVGYNEDTVSDCLYLGSTVGGDNSVGAIVGYIEGYYATVENCYFTSTTITSAVGSNTGTVAATVGLARTVAAGTGVTIDAIALTGTVTHYDDYHDIITAYSGGGIEYAGNRYYGNGCTVRLTLSNAGEAPAGYMFAGAYTASAGTLSGNATDVYTLAMPDADVTISAVIAPDPDHFSVSGDEYTIKTPAGWGVFCDALQDNTTYNRFSGKTVKLGNNIGTAQAPITRMAGGSGHEFTGTFDGDGKTLTVNYTNTGNNVMTAPFSYVNGATIQNLIVGGTISGTAYRAAGIVGETTGQTTITNCVSSVDISSGRYTGGISIGGLVTITGCVFNGKIVGTTYSGGFVGFSNTATAISNSLFAPQDGSSISGGTFYYNGDGDITPTNSYYTRTLGTPQGKQAHSITAGENVTVANAGTPETVYTVSGITAYTTGIKYNDVLYAGSGDAVSLTLSNTATGAPAGYQYDGYTVSAGTLDDNNILTMPDQDVTVSLALTVLPWTGYGTESSPYIIYNKDQLDLLAHRVNGTHGETANNYYNTYFKLNNDISYPHTSDWNDFNSHESNYEAIGGYYGGSDRYFSGHFDGNNKTISGIRIYKGGGDETDFFQGIFGQTDYGADIHDLTLADARITGYDFTGGIVGYNNVGTTITRCHVAGDVAVCAGQSIAWHHGGIVGRNHGTIEQCTSAATLTTANATNSKYYGGIAGRNSGTLCDNLAIGATVPATADNTYGAITGGNYNGGTLQRNYYAACNVANVENATGVGCGSIGNDDDGYTAADVNNDNNPNGAVCINTLALAANQAPDQNYWTTYYNSALGFTIDADENACAYTAEYDDTNSQLTLHKLGKVIPKGTAVIIVGEDNEISMTASDETVTVPTNNLDGVDVRTEKSTLGSGTFYVLGSTTKNGFGFHKYNADYMPARKAYLLIADSSAPSLTMVFDNETTEIKTTDFTDYTDKADTWYSLDGRKLDKQPTAKGIYIHNGRKEVVR